MKQKKALPDDAEGKAEEDEYEVEDIVDFRFFKKQPKYLVKWKGFPDSDNTWEPEANLKNLPGFTTKMKMLKAAHTDSRAAETAKSQKGSGNTSARSEPVEKKAPPSSEAAVAPPKKQRKAEASPAAQSAAPEKPALGKERSSAAPSKPQEDAAPRVRGTGGLQVPNKVSDPVKEALQTPAEPEEAVEVEDLLDYKPRFKKDYFLVRWKGEWEDSWEPRHNLLIVGDLMNKMIDLKMSYLRIYGPGEMEEEVFVTVQSIRISGSATLSAVVVEMTRDTESRSLLSLQEVRRRWPQQLLDFLLSRLRLRASGESVGDRSGGTAHIVPLK